MRHFAASAGDVCGPRASRAHAYHDGQEIASDPIACCAPWVSAAWGRFILAERADAQFEQQVAIKVVHGGSSRGVQSRLKIERQILAQLDHPNIAHLLDGGALPDGTRLYRHGVRRRRPHRRVLRLEPTRYCRTAAAVSDRMRRGALRPSEPHRASRPQALEYFGDGRRACPSCWTSASPNYWTNARRDITPSPSPMPTFAS